jgi:hypothetical protein
VSETDFRPVDPDDDRPARDQAAMTTSPETPEADAAEQLREVVDDDVEETSEPPYDADPADAAEQRMAVAFDDDEYR